LVSRSYDGQSSNGTSQQASVSFDGRFVTYTSSATNLVPGDTNGVDDVFVHDTWYGGTTRVSVDSSGNQADLASGFDKSPISDDGRYVVFASSATNLVLSDTNAAMDVFRHDRQSGVTLRVSVGGNGVQIHGNSNDAAVSGDGLSIAFDSDAPDAWGADANGAKDVFLFDASLGTALCVSLAPSGWTGNGESLKPALSADGRWVAFTSAASNLVPDDTNGASDTFLWDRDTHHTVRISVDSTGLQANGPSNSVRLALSQDGRYTAFLSLATNLVANDINGVQDLFVRDQWSGTTERVTTDSSGAQANAASSGCSISHDGRFVSFGSFATNLVPDDTNGASDVFVKDRASGATLRVSLDDDEHQANGASSNGRFSGDGRIIVFQSLASDLVPGDTNGASDVFARLWEPTPCGQDVGTYCPGLINTTGESAQIDWQGSTSLAQNDFVLKVSHAPPLHAGIFFFGCYATSVPFGEGLLCVTGQQHRLPMVHLGPDGTGAYALDVANPAAAEALIAPESTWNFQFWYRDPQPVGHGFNLSNALRAHFCP
jgi:Tol biopolymer transport system component